LAKDGSSASASSASLSAAPEKTSFRFAKARFEYSVGVGSISMARVYAAMAASNLFHRLNAERFQHAAYFT
jgi:Zn-dependent protease